MYIGILAPIDAYWENTEAAESKLGQLLLIMQHSKLLVESI